MAFESETTLDQTDWQILKLLQTNARISFAELGRIVHLSPPAVAERIRKMELRGIINGYYTLLEPTQLGLTIHAFIRILTTTDKYPQLIFLAENDPHIRALHHIAGGESFLMEVRVASITQLEHLIGKINGETNTTIVMSSPVQKHGFDLKD